VKRTKGEYEEARKLPRGEVIKKGVLSWRRETVSTSWRRIRRVKGIETTLEKAGFHRRGEKRGTAKKRAENFI